MGKAGDTAAGAGQYGLAGAGLGFMVGGPWGAAIGGGAGALYGGITGYMSSEEDTGMGGTAQQINQESGWHTYDGQDTPEGGPSGAQKRAQYYDSLGSFYGNRADARADYTQADADYANQSALGQQYRDVLEGKAPSLAEMQMRAGQDQANQAALNMAASSRGGGALLGAQQAQAASALGNQQVTRDAAMLRAQEQAQARGQYGQMLGEMRSESGAQAQAQAQIQLASEQQRYGQSLGYRQEADARREGERDANIGIAQSNQSAQTAVQTGSQQAAAADRASQRGATAGLLGSALGAGATIYGSKGGGGKKLCPTTTASGIRTAPRPSPAPAGNRCSSRRASPSRTSTSRGCRADSR